MSYLMHKLVQTPLEQQFVTALYATMYDPEQCKQEIARAHASYAPNSAEMRMARCMSTLVHQPFEVLQLMHEEAVVLLGEQRRAERKRPRDAR